MLADNGNVKPDAGNSRFETDVCSSVASQQTRPRTHLAKQEKRNGEIQETTASRALTGTIS
jgi:hypothetical protein